MGCSITWGGKPNHMDRWELNMSKMAAVMVHKDDFEVQLTQTIKYGFGIQLTETDP